MNLLAKFLNLFRRRKLEAEMSDEMRHHLEEQTRRNVQAGMPLPEAAHAAQRTFGGVEQIKEHCRDERVGGFAWIGHAWSDLGYAARVLRKNPGFSSVAILTLGLSMG